jgi:hypothetical protein
MSLCLVNLTAMIGMLASIAGPYLLQCNGDQDMDRRSTMVTGVDFSSGARESGVKGATKLYLGKTGIEGKFLKKGTIFYSHRAVGKRCTRSQLCHNCDNADFIKPYAAQFR